MTTPEKQRELLDVERRFWNAIKAKDAKGTARMTDDGCIVVGAQGLSAIDQKTMALQYLEALKALGASPSTKFVIPTEFTRLIEPFAGYLSKGMGGSGEAGK